MAGGDIGTSWLGIGLTRATLAVFGIWWLDPVVALGIAGVAVQEGGKALRGESCGCAAC